MTETGWGSWDKVQFSLSLSFCLSFCLSVSLTLSFCLSLTLFLSACLRLSLSVSLICDGDWLGLLG